MLMSVVLLTIGLCSSCDTPIVNQRATPLSSDTPLEELQLNAMVEILTLLKEPEFKKYILDECLKQKHGDYNVHIKDIVSHYQEVDRYKKSMARLDSIVTLIKPMVDNREPLVFYPRAETIEDERNGSTIARTKEEIYQEPIGVIQPPLNSEPPEGTTGFRVNRGGGWQWVQSVTEADAWDNDIFVIGTDENVEMYGGRTNGGAEFAGQIQVTNLNSIEHWTSGKLEFKLIVRSANNVEISNRDFGKVSRRNFRNQAWYDFGHSVGNWNTANWGNYTIENWWERDGGGTSSTTISAPAANGLPGISYTVNHGSDDNSFGTSMVQFTDPVTQVYQISYMNFKRRF